MNLDSIVDEILDIDKKRRELTGEVESKKAEQNADSKKIPQLKKAGEDTAPLMERMKALSAEIKGGRTRNWRSWRKSRRICCFPCPTCRTRTFVPAARSRTSLSAILRSSLSLTMSRKTTWSFAKAWG